MADTTDLMKLTDLINPEEMQAITIDTKSIEDTNAAIFDLFISLYKEGIDTISKTNPDVNKKTYIGEFKVMLQEIAVNKIGKFLDTTEDLQSFIKYIGTEMDQQEEALNAKNHLVFEESKNAVSSLLFNAFTK